jgi:Na+-transporting NADH:ubiquinone oxidoreductase subunit NqrC
MLEERILQDRNKGISNEINRNIFEHAGIESSFDEYQIGDYMAKTIRPKLTELVQKWDSSHSSKSIENDNQAIHQAQKLGLLPIPEKIKNLIYSRVGE